MRKCNIWGRDFDIAIRYECYEGQEVTPHQQEAEKIFEENITALLKNPEAVRQYILENNQDDVDDNVENIFRYVIPTALFIKRDEEKRIVALMCNYRFDIEHGLALVFENEKLKQIGPQDIL